MPEKAQDLYGSFGSVQTADQSASGSGAHYLDSHATANDFGGQIGEAAQSLGQTTEKVGNEGLDLATHFAQMATEAKVNDDYANKYAPAAADLRSNYDQLQGQDKVNGYDGYISSLQQLNAQYTGSTKSPYEKQLMSGLIDRHISGEIDGAKRELVESQKLFSNQAVADKIKADSGYAADNYNNPQIVNQVTESNNNSILMQHIDQGYDPNNSDHSAVIQDAQRQAQGQMVNGMITRALASGDAQSANGIRSSYAAVIPGYQQIAIDNTLHQENIRQTSANSSQALKIGQPLPQAVGAPPSQVQAVVANTAHASGVDPNHALTVAWIESRDGQDVGKRGDIGQTGKPAANIEEQSINMVSELKKSETYADQAVGGKSEPWQQYMCYQQGSGGGPALLKASMSGSDAKAVDVLAPFYKSRSDAVSAIVNNGGNASMTSTDFANFIKKKYTDNAQRAQCYFPSDSGGDGTTVLSQSRPGDAITDAHTQGGQTVQPAASPRQALNNFDEKYPDMVNRANSIPNYEVRQNVLSALSKDRQVLASSASAYSSQLISKASQYAIDPTFTDMKQLPSDLAAELVVEHPDTMNYLEKAAERNLDKSSGSISKDQKEYGPGMFNLMRDIHDGKIKGVDELMKHLPQGDNPGDITLSGYDRLTKEFTHDPESQSEATMKTQAFKVVKRDLSGEDDISGIKDPKGEALYAQALPKLFHAVEDGKSKGIPVGELYDPSNPHWIGNTVKSLKRTSVQMSMDLMNAVDNPNGTPTPDKSSTPPTRTFANILQDYKKETDPAKKAALKKEAEDAGFVRKETSTQPEVPITQ